MSSSSGKKQSTETPPKNIFTKLLSSRRKRDKEVGKKQSTEGINNNNNNKKDDDAAGMLTCEENAAGEPSPGAGSPMSIKQKRKKKKGNKEGTVEEDETLKAKKSKEKKEEKEKDELKTAKKKKKSGKKDKTEEAPPQPSGMATVFEPIKTPSRPAVAHHKEMNKNFQEDMERIEREEKRDKDKQQIQQPIDEFAPTVFEPVQAAIQPAVSSGKPKKQLRQGVSPALVSPAPDSSENEAKPVYLSIPKENATTARERKSGSHQRSAESTKTGKEGSKKAVQHSDSQDDADCKTAMIPASAVKVAPYQMVMYKGVPRYEPVNKSSRPYIKSEKEVAAKIQMLPQPCTAPTSPTLPSSDQNNYNNNNNGPKSPAKSPATSPGNKGIIIGTLPKDQQQQPPPPEDPKLAPVSQYIAPLDR